MQSLTILNTREIKEVQQILREEFGAALEPEYAYLRNDKDKLFIISKDLARIEWKNLLIDKVGLYLGELHDHHFRLSKEGAQLFVRQADKQKLKNVIALTMAEVQEYCKGKDLEKDLGPENRLVIIRYESDTLGCAQYKEGKILNFLPKIHRGEVIL